MVVYRLPWVEVGRLVTCRSGSPSWPTSGLSTLLGPDATFDVVAHSYGTAVVNRSSEPVRERGWRQGRRGMVTVEPEPESQQE